MKAALKVVSQQVQAAMVSQQVQAAKNRVELMVSDDDIDIEGEPLQEEDHQMIEDSGKADELPKANADSSEQAKPGDDEQTLKPSDTEGNEEEGEDEEGGSSAEDE